MTTARTGVSIAPACDAVGIVSDGWLGSVPQMWTTLTAWEKLQIEQAAAGCVSGTLREWPLLRLALISIGVPDSKDFRRTPASRLREICAAIMARLPNIEVSRRSPESTQSK